MNGVASASGFAGVPVIETERMILRAPRVEDFEPYADVVLSDRWFDRGATREGAWLDFNQMVAGWLLQGTGLLSVDWREDGRLVGFVLVHQEYGDAERELGWILTAEDEGHGYASEAARAFRDHAEAAFGVSGLVSYIEAENTRSIRVAERLGASRDTTAEAGIDSACHVYRHPVTA